MKRLFSIALAAVLTFSMVACASANSNVEIESTDTTQSAVNSAFPITITHAFGETVIQEKPERIVSIHWGNQDTALALGYAPVGISENNYGALEGEKLLPWTKEALTDLGAKDSTLIFSDTDGLDFEAISETKPDIILAAYSGITEEDYKTLSSIAPVVAYPQKPWQTLWRDQTLVIAEALGLKEEGKKLVSDTEALIAEKVAAYPEFEGKTIAFAYFDPTDLSTISLYTTADPRAAFLEDLGFETAPSVLELAKDAESFYISVSAENADKLADIDIILTWASGDGGEMLKMLQDHPLYGAIPAVKNGAIVMFSESPLAAAQTPTVLSIPATIDDYLDEISKAAKNVK